MKKTKSDQSRGTRPRKDLPSWKSPPLKSPPGPKSVTRNPRSENQPGQGSPKSNPPAPVADAGSGLRVHPKHSPEKFFRKGDQRPEGLWLFGRHEVLTALRGGSPVEAIHLADTAHGPVIDEICAAARQARVRLNSLPAGIFQKRYGTSAQGVAAHLLQFPYVELPSLIGASAGLLVALHGVEDPRNLGAIVRTVEASGANGVIIPLHRAAGMTEGALATAQGAASLVPVARVTNLGAAVESLKSQGYWAVGLDGAASQDFWMPRYPDKVVLVAGGEHVGLGNRVLGLCDETVRIPLAGQTPSLNVSVSVAIALYEILRQREALKKGAKTS